jgi:hypothetical protein
MSEGALPAAEFGGEPGARRERLRERGACEMRDQEPRDQPVAGTQRVDDMRGLRRLSPQIVARAPDRAPGPACHHRDPGAAGDRPRQQVEACRIVAAGRREEREADQGQHAREPLRGPFLGKIVGQQPRRADDARQFVVEIRIATGMDRVMPGDEGKVAIAERVARTHAGPRSHEAPVTVLVRDARARRLAARNLAHMRQVDALGRERRAQDRAALVVAPAAEIGRLRPQPARERGDIDGVSARELKPGRHVGVDRVVADAEDAGHGAWTRAQYPPFHI